MIRIYAIIRITNKESDNGSTTKQEGKEINGNNVQPSNNTRLRYN